MRHSRHFLKCIAVGISLFVLLAAGPVGAQTPQSTFDPAGPVAKMQLDLMSTTLWLVVLIFIIVGGGMLYAVIRFRSRPGDEMPRQIHGNTRLEVIWTAIPILLLIIIAVPTVKQSFQLASPPAGERLEVRVTGNQWWWAFEYPELGFATANELRIPVGKTVHLTLKSNDVIHSFWVPRLAGKLDVLPNKENTMWFQADEPGTYLGQCAEFCGTSHANMRFRVVALPQEAFDAWVAGRQTVTAVAPSSELAAHGKELFLTGACAACHTIDGTTAQGEVGPDLTDVGNRTTLAAGILDNTPENLAEWLQDPQAIKPGSLMPNLKLSDGDIQALTAFLGGLK